MHVKNAFVTVAIFLRLGKGFTLRKYTQIKENVIMSG